MKGIRPACGWAWIGCMSALLGILLSLLACRKPQVEASGARPIQAAAVQDPAWFGEGIDWSPRLGLDFAWAAEGLDVRGKSVELAPWTVVAGGPPRHRESVVQILQRQAVEGVALAQEMQVPAGNPPAYRLEGRILSLDRRTRVGAKAGQVAYNTLLVPVDATLILLAIASGGGGMQKGMIMPMEDVPGYRTEVLYQVRLQDLATGRPVLAIQSWARFDSLHVPRTLRGVIFTLAGGSQNPLEFETSESLVEEGGDQLWWAPGLDLTGAWIRCLNWKGEDLWGEATEAQERQGLLAIRMPDLLIGEREDARLLLSRDRGTLFLQAGYPLVRGKQCRVKLWDSETGRVLGRMVITSGRDGPELEKDWARRIRRHLAGRIPGAQAAPEG